MTWTFWQRLGRKKQLLLVPVMLGPILLYHTVPIAYAFFWNDKAYRQMVSSPERGTSLADDLRTAAAKLTGVEGFTCRPRDGEPPMDPIYSVIAWLDHAAFSRQPSLSGHSSLFFMAGHLDLGLLRVGFEASDQIGRWYREYGEVKAKKLEPYCDAQREHAILGEPFDPPLAIYGEVRAMLLREAEHTDAAVAEYRRIRVPLTACIGLLIAWQVASVLFYLWLGRSMLRELARRHSSRPPDR